MGSVQWDELKPFISDEKETKVPIFTVNDIEVHVDSSDEHMAVNPDFIDCRGGKAWATTTRPMIWLGTVLPWDNDTLRRSRPVMWITWGKKNEVQDTSQTYIPEVQLLSPKEGKVSSEKPMRGSTFYSIAAVSVASICSWWSINTYYLPFPDSIVRVPCCYFKDPSPNIFIGNSSSHHRPKMLSTGLAAEGNVWIISPC